MPVDPSILLSLKSAPMVATPQQRLQTQTAQLELSEKQREVRDRMRLQGVIQKYGGDWEKALPEINSISPTLGLEVQKSLYEAQTHVFNLQSARLRHQADVAGMMGRLAGGVDNQQKLDTLRMTVQQESPQDAARIPLIWDDASTPQFIEGMKQHALSAEQQFQNDEKKAADLRAEKEAERKAARDFAIDQGKQAAEARQQAAAERAAKKPIAIAPGTVLVNPETYQPVASGGPKERIPAAAGSFEDYVLRYAAGKQKTPEQLSTADIEDARKRYQQADDRPRVDVSVSGSKEDAKVIADAIASGDQPPVTTGLYRLAGPVRAELAKQGYNLTTANLDWEATKKHLSTLNGAQQTRLRQAISTASDSLGVIEDLAKQWDGGRFPLLNKASLAAAKNGAMGPKAQQIATNLTAQITDVTSELGNVYMGGNSPTDHALGLAAKNLSADWTRDQLLSAIKLARTNLQIRQNSITNAGAITSTSQTAAPATATPKPTHRYNPATGKIEEIK